MDQSNIIFENSLHVGRIREHIRDLALSNPQITNLFSDLKYKNNMITSLAINRLVLISYSIS